MENATSSFSEGNIKLRDGRRLAYAEYGDPKGKPIFFFHATPGSRLFHHPDNSIALSAGARIIAIDRPGFGGSDFKPGRTLLDWPNDVVELADALSIGQFAVVGYSAGGPYAAACAARIPHRLTAAGLIGSMAPLDNPRMTKGIQGMSHMFFTLDRHVPPLARLGCRLMCTSWKHNPDQYLKSQINGFVRSDEAKTMLASTKAMLTVDLVESVRTGTQGICWDLALLARPWGFHLHAITTNVYVWHGEADNKAPLTMGKRLASAIPHCRAMFFPGEGHSAIYTHWQDILATLASGESLLGTAAQPVEVPEALPKISPCEEVLVSTECSVINLIEASAKSPQKLGPSREAAKPALTEAEQVKMNAAVLSPEPSAGPALQSAEPVIAQSKEEQNALVTRVSANKPRKAEKARPEAKKSVSKSSARSHAKATASKVDVVPEEQKPAREASKPATAKTPRNGSRTTAHTPAHLPEELKPAPQAAKSAAPKTVKGRTKAILPATAETPDKEKPHSEKAKIGTTKPTGHKAGAVDHLPAATSDRLHPAREVTKLTSKKSTSGRKSAKEAVSV